MATTATTTPNEPVTYTLLVIFTVDPRTGERLQDQQTIRDEAHGWLASLDATVHGVNIRKATSPAGRFGARHVFVFSRCNHSLSRPEAVDTSGSVPATIGRGVKSRTFVSILVRTRRRAEARTRRDIHRPLRFAPATDGWHASEMPRR